VLQTASRLLRIAHLGRIAFFCLATLPAALSLAPRAHAGEAEVLFDGTAMGKWKVIDSFDFRRHGRVYVDQGRIVLGPGQPATGVRWTGPMPKSDYEVSLEAMRVEGSDFFCGLTFPVGESFCTLIVGGWHGPVVGLSNVDGLAAVENDTTTSLDFKNNQWYRIRLRVTGEKIETWIDDKKMFEQLVEGHKFSIWWEQEPARPLGIVSWDTGAAVRDIRLQRIATR
jgi:hypothetical protein